MSNLPENLTAILGVEQQQRVLALTEARKVLETRGASNGPFTAASNEPPSCDDLLAVADYIVNGVMWLEDGEETTGVKVQKTVEEEQ